jgi:hypothetical protein
MFPSLIKEAKETEPQNEKAVHDQLAASVLSPAKIQVSDVGS